jgi:hypothetical protein
MLLEYEEVMTFDQPYVGYDTSDVAGSSSTSGGQVAKKKSIKSDSSVELRGPMQVDGSVKSMGAVTFKGDFSVRDRIEAYGNIEIDGSLTCQYVTSLLAATNYNVRRTISDKDTNMKTP